MNTAPQCLSRFVYVAPLQSQMRNGMEEVVGSIPTRSTKLPNDSDEASTRTWFGPPLHATADVTSNSPVRYSEFRKFTRSVTSCALSPMLNRTL